MNQEKNYLILVINPGSTSTKIAIFENEKCKYEKSLRHSTTELEKFEKIWDQYEFRKKEILAFLHSQGFDLSKLSCVVGRGGLLKPIEGGTYKIDQRMIADLRRGVQGQHASNLGGVLAFGIGWDYSIPSFIVDPPAVDEFDPISRISGLAEIPRTSLFHALNIKATARKAARDMHKTIEDLNLIIAHLGGGITIAAMRKGRVIDSNNGIGEGPFSPERTGALPLTLFVDMCFSGKYDKKTIMKKLAGQGGLVSYLNTNNASEVQSLIRAGNAKAKLVFEAMAYQISCEIAARSVALYGKLDAIILTGGMAHVDLLTTLIKERCSFLGNILVYPGEDELEALALGGLRVLKGEETAKIYDVEKKTVGIFFHDQLAEYDQTIEVIETRFRELGFRFRQQDENFELLIRNCKGNSVRMHDVIEEFLSRKVDLIIALGSPAAYATKLYLKGKDVPVLCTACFDPVVMGLMESYGGSDNNITGTSYRINIETQIKKGILSLMPNLKRLGVVYKTGELQSEIQLDEATDVTERLGITLVKFDAQNPGDLKDAEEFFRENNVEAVLLVADTTLASADELSLQHIVSNFPTTCTLKSVLRKGGLVGVIADWTTINRKATDMIVQMLEGTPPSSISVVKDTEAKVYVNAKTLKKFNMTDRQEFMNSVDEILFKEESEGENV
ncbi:MAG: butyrate kinase [Candidatus Riflebacteria bacterium]|nr:butyrate kinase [Candidatus Riflebacteria bacterium]